MVYVSVNYKYKALGKPTFTGTSGSFTLPQQSETLLMQKIRDKHKGCEIQITDIKWK